MERVRASWLSDRCFRGFSNLNRIQVLAACWILVIFLYENCKIYWDFIIAVLGPCDCLCKKLWWLSLAVLFRRDVVISPFEFLMPPVPLFVFLFFSCACANKKQTNMKFNIFYIGMKYWLSRTFVWKYQQGYPPAKTHIAETLEDIRFSDDK